MKTLLSFDGVGFRYAERQVLADVSFTLEEGSCTALIGPNGVGKTTLLRLGSGSLKPSAGSVLIESKPPAEMPHRLRSRLVALVPQQLDVPFDFTVNQIVEQGRTPYLGLLRGPMRFIVIRSLAIRTAVHQIFEEATAEAAAAYKGEQAKQYNALKLEGILEAPQNLCIVYDTRSERGHQLGRMTMPETAAYSTVCAIQNLWLAARAEGVGVGWVSILDPSGSAPFFKSPSMSFRWPTYAWDMWMVLRLSPSWSSLAGRSVCLFTLS